MLRARLPENRDSMIIRRIRSCVGILGASVVHESSLKESIAFQNIGRISININAYIFLSSFRALSSFATVQ
jgi:hypothetical protein